jgi:transposase
VERRAFGGGSVMVWGGITATGRTPLVVVNGNLNAVRYRDEILQTHVIPFINAQQRHITFQHDNARPHVARVVQDFLAQQNVDVLQWPAISPDLSPIEHVWDEMKRRLRRFPNQPLALQQLNQRLVHIWNNIPQAFVDNVVGSMRRRCEACIAANGGHTRY